MCGCGNGGRKNVNLMLMRRQAIARRNRQANQQVNNIEQVVNQQVAQVQSPVPGRFIGNRRRFPFLVRRRFG
jgi:hypothetical protein